MTVARRLNAGRRFAATATACLLCFACGGGSTAPAANTGGSPGASGAQSAGGSGPGPGGAPAGGSNAAAAGSSAAGAAVGGAPSAGGAGGAAGAPASGAGSSGANATAGAAGTATAGAGGAGPTPVVPVQGSSANLYRFSFNDTVLEIDAQTGGRVSKLALSGADMMMTAATDPTTWGSVFWTSPRLKTWMPEWPPPAAIDNGPYTATISGSHLMLTGMADSTLGVSIAKDYSADSASGWITINYTINASKALKAAPWEVSRVPRGGIAFFPAGTSVKPGPLTVTQSGGMVWFDDGPKTATSPDGAKLVADGANGWEAYVSGGNLFLKRFTDQPVSAQVPDGEGEICLYPGSTSDKSSAWVEFEVQGPYTSIPAAGNLSWKVQWRLVKIPSSVSVAVGSASLVSFVQQQVAIP
ncbi:MAG TPA: hypothetical protein VFK05_25265 [Polyangiaceae bacterium]|nr:hypothetical protein [Polyangiaceae bacterium]